MPDPNARPPMPDGPVPEVQPRDPDNDHGSNAAADLEQRIAEERKANRPENAHDDEPRSPEFAVVPKLLHEWYVNKVSYAAARRAQIVALRADIDRLSRLGDDAQQEAGEIAAVLSIVDPDHAPGWSEQRAADARATMGGTVANGTGLAVGGVIGGHDDPVVISRP